MAARATGEQHRRGRWMRRVCFFAFDHSGCGEADGLNAKEDIDLQFL